MQSVHPGWCDPRYCCFTDIDVQHRSTPTLLTTRDHAWWFTLARADEWAHPKQQGDTELLIDVHSTLLRVPHVQHVLRTDEIESYANRLLTERRRAQLLGMPVPRDVTAASPARPQSRKAPAGRDTHVTTRRTSA
jgi:hypothetical protein